MLHLFKSKLQFLKLTFFASKVRKAILSKKEDKDILNEKILFCPFNSSILNLFRESVIAAACEKKGADVAFFQYDLSHGAIDFLYDQPKYKFKLYYWFGKLFYIKNKLSVYQLSKYNPYINKDQIKRTIDKTPVDKLGEFKYKNIKIGQYAIASSIRFFLSPFPLWDNKNFVKWVRDFIYTGCVIADGFLNIIDKEKPNKIVTSHAIYISWGVLYDVARMNGINVDVYNGSYRKNTLRFYHNERNAPFPIAEWPSFENRELNNKELNILNNYIESREDQKNDNIQLFSENSDYTTIDDFVKKAKNKNAKIACLYTNISWDAYAHANDCPFESMEEWLIETIEHLKNMPNLYVILKAHPAEVYHKVPDKFRVKNFIPDNLPDHILFVNENANIRPFYIYDIIDFGIIHLSTVCIEMALKNIPVLTSGGNSHYSNKNFTIDPKSKQEYFQHLMDLASGKSTFKPDIEIAKKYMFYRFFREAIPFEALEIQNGKYNIPKEFPEKLSGINLITEGIVNNEKFIFDWTN